MTPNPYDVLADRLWAMLSIGARIVLLVLLTAALTFIGWAVSVDHHPPAPPVTEPWPGEPSGYGLAAPTGELLPAITGRPAAVTSSGSLAYADPGYGRLYLALPEPLGTLATICGPADCVTRSSTDYGPDQRKHPERIADLSARDFEKVCGVDAAQRVMIGRCPGTVTILGRPHGTLPPTDGE